MISWWNVLIKTHRFPPWENGFDLNWKGTVHFLLSIELLESSEKQHSCSPLDRILVMTAYTFCFRLFLLFPGYLQDEYNSEHLSGHLRTRGSNQVLWLYWSHGLLVFTGVMSLEVKRSQNDRFFSRTISEVSRKVIWLVKLFWLP